MMQSFVEILRRHAVDQPDREAFTFLSEDAEESRCTYGELDARARAIGTQLREGGTGHVLLLYAPGRHFVEAFFGCLYAGRVAVPVYPPDPINVERALTRLRHVLADARPSTIATTREVRELMVMFEDKVPELAPLEWAITDEAEPPGTRWSEPSESWDGVAMLQYTSGSTLSPRGVMLTHGNLLTNSAYIKEAFGHSTASQGVIWLPPYHDMGLIGGILQPVFSGFPCALMSPLDFLQRPIRWLRAVSRFRATTSGGPNFAYELCAKKIGRADCEGLDLSSWSVAFNGAEPINAATMERFVDVFGPLGFRAESFLPCYGLAESTLAVTCTPKSALPTVGTFDPHSLGLGKLREPSGEAPEVSRLVSCGRPPADHRVVIVDPETRLTCADRNVGEIWISGPSVAKGYWEKPAETQATFGASLADTGEGPFLRTGDLGAMLDGELYVSGRLKDVMIIHGRNYYPHDIEATVYTCHSELRPNCGVAFTVAGGDGERLVVVQEVRRLQDLNSNEVIMKIRGAVAQHHRVQVQSVVLLPPRALPKTSSGKVQRQLCRTLFLKGELDVVATWSLNQLAVS
ncbi:MAG: fatty acyl-AMP ligase [Myxococcaceae bacterium]|nr:fatty acyl-AMP ligase [Myxococcaceae bacterium]